LALRKNCRSRILAGFATVGVALTQAVRAALMIEVCSDRGPDVADINEVSTVAVLALDITVNVFEFLNDAFSFRPPLRLRVPPSLRCSSGLRH
jgi:hypothetical protein